MCPEPYESWMSEAEEHAPPVESRPARISAAAPSKSWLLALDDRQLERTGFRPIVPEAPAPRCVRMPSARNSEFQGHAFHLGRWSRPIYWTLGALAALGVVLAGWQVLRAHANVKPAPKPAVPAPQLQPSAPEIEMETGSLLRTNARDARGDSLGLFASTPASAASARAPSAAAGETVTDAAATSALLRRLVLDPRLEARARELARGEGPLFDAFPRVSSAARATQSARSAPLFAAPREASAPRVRIVGRANVSGVWEGATIPLDALDGRAQWLTPAVGRVRAELADGAAIEGRLHSLGEGKLWIETELGRLALLGSQVRSLRQLAPSASPGATTDPALLPEVSVRTPGGVFRGRLLAREGARVTLLTPEGGRVTLDGAELASEPAAPRALPR